MRIYRYLRYLLFPFGLIYGVVMAIRNGLYHFGLFKSYAFDVPVISIGNISVGGTGKTPHTEWIIQNLMCEHKVAVLSRGYGRSSKGFVEVHTDTLVSVSGDEPLQMKRKFPEITVAVNENRADGIRKLLEMDNAPDVILLDDAFQHRRVKPGLQLLLVDFNRPIHHDLVLPAGNLREFSSGRKRADLVLMTKCPNLFEHEMESLTERYIKGEGQQMFFTTFEYQKPEPVFPAAAQMTMKELSESEVLLVTGIANPEPLKVFLSDKCKRLEHIDFPDHYNFGKNDINKILLKYSQLEGTQKRILTTEKDAVRLKEFSALQNNLRNNLFYIPIGVKVMRDGSESLKQIIQNYVRKN